MIQYTTPTITFIVETLLYESDDIYVTFKQDGKEKLTKSSVDILDRDDKTTTISVLLTQEDTGSFDYEKTVEIQVNWVTSDGSRDATMPYKEPVFRNLLDEVKSYGG